MENDKMLLCVGFVSFSLTSLFIEGAAQGASLGFLGTLGCTGLVLRVSVSSGSVSVSVAGGDDGRSLQPTNLSDQQAPCTFRRLSRRNYGTSLRTLALETWGLLHHLSPPVARFPASASDSASASTSVKCHAR
jgi:hypothetical protein